MSLPVKIGLFFVIIVGLLAGLGIYLQKQLTPEKVHAYLIPLLETRLERSVEIGDVQIGLLSGIVVKDLTIKQKRRPTVDFVAVQQVELNYQLWPLLTGRIVVNQIVLDRPVISVSRYQDGTFNFTDLVGQSARQQKSILREKSVSVANSLLSLLVKNISIHDGLLNFTDAVDNQKAPYRYKLSSLNLNIRDFNLENKFPVDLSVRLNGSQIDLSGHYNLADNSGDLVLHLAELDLVPLAPYYRNSIPAKLGAGQLALNIEADFLPGQISSKGKLTLSDLDLALQAKKNTTFKKAQFSADYSVKFDQDTRRLNIATLMLNLDDIVTTVEGTVVFSDPAPVVDLAVLLKGFDLRQVMNRLPDSLIRDYQQYSLAGKVDGRLALRGSVEHPARLFQSADLSLDDVQISTETLRVGLGGDISYRDQVLKATNMSLSYGNQDLVLTLDAKKVNGTVFKGTFSLVADSFNCNEVLGSANVSDNGSSLPNVAATQEIGPFSLPLDLVGTLTANSVQYRNLVFDHAYAEARIYDNRLRLGDIKANFGNGRIKGDGQLNLGVRGLAYSGDLQFSDIDLSRLYRGLYPQGAYDLSGTLQLDSIFSGQGSQKNRSLRALKMQGAFSVYDGAVSGFPIADKVATFVGGEELRSATFSSIKGRYQVANHVMNQASLLEGSKLKLSSQGDIDLDGYLNLKLDARVGPKVLRRSGTVAEAMAALTDAQGWGMIPLQVQGRMDSPQVRPDADVIKSMLADRAQQEIMERLSEELDAKGRSQDGVQKMLDSTLDRLFGK